MNDLDNVSPQTIHLAKQLSEKIRLHHPTVWPDENHQPVVGVFVLVYIALFAEVTTKEELLEKAEDLFLASWEAYKCGLCTN